MMLKQRVVSELNKKILIRTITDLLVFFSWLIGLATMFE